jgi:hypothetical protein
MIHLLTCIQISLCTHRDYENSWMGPKGKDVSKDSFLDQYIVGLYFVTTTISTCGFGDISATQHDIVENGVFIFQILVGMMFYSYTIQKI